jgi:hypothetical protein
MSDGKIDSCYKNHDKINTYAVHDQVPFEDVSFFIQLG